MRCWEVAPSGCPGEAETKAVGDLGVQPKGGRDLGDCLALSPCSIPQEEGCPPPQGHLVSEVSDWLVVWASHCPPQGLLRGTSEVLLWLWRAKDSPKNIAQRARTEPRTTEEGCGEQDVIQIILKRHLGF